MAAIGGRLTTCVRGDGWFDVLAQAPLTSARTHLSNTH